MEKTVSHSSPRHISLSLQEVKVSFAFHRTHIFQTLQNTCLHFAILPKHHRSFDSIRISEKRGCDCLQSKSEGCLRFCLHGQPGEFTCGAPGLDGVRARQARRCVLCAQAFRSGRLTAQVPLQSLPGKNSATLPKEAAT